MRGLYLLQASMYVRGNCISITFPRSALYATLLLAPGCILLAGPDCRSWCLPSRGTTKRSFINVLGVGHEFVQQGNMMASRWLVWMFGVECWCACDPLSIACVWLF